LESKLCGTMLPQMQQLPHQTLQQVAVHLNLSHSPPSLPHLQHHRYQHSATLVS
jgi:hypothetical protein